MTKKTFHFFSGNYLLLPLGVVIALLWSNVFPLSYYTVARILEFPVNQVAMVLFFGLVAQEIFEELMPGGALHRWRRWTVPVVAAVGGVAGAAVIYGLYVEWYQEPMLHAAWPVVAAVDITFAYFLVKIVFHRHPAVPFLLLLAVVSNVIAAIAIAPAYVFAGGRSGGSALLMAAAIGLALWLRRRHVHAFWPYIVVAGGLSWTALYLEGFHPALALVPIVPLMPHTRRTLENLFADEDDAKRDTPRHFEHVWHHYVQVALFLFGLVNAGVALTFYGTGTWATLFASLIGRTAGVLLAVAAAVAFGLHLPAQLKWREMTVVALAASCGFTFTLFFATALYPPGPLLSMLKLGALFTIAGIPLALGAARLLHVGRYAVHHRARVHHAVQHKAA